MGIWGGQNRGRGGAILTPNELVLTFRGSYVCANFGENRSSPVKIQFNPKKLLQKVFQLILLGFSVVYNILKVYQNRSLGKVFFSRWRPRWPPKPSSGHKSVTINSKLMIFVSISMFSGARNTLKP